jgi:hypothetical protein
MQNVCAPGWLSLCVCRWGRETFEHLVALVHSEDAVQAGVQLCYAHCLYLAPEPDPFWSNSVHGFRRMSEEELQVGDAGLSVFKSGLQCCMNCTVIQLLLLLLLL